MTGMAKKKLSWESVERNAKGRFSMENVGSLSFEVESTLPGGAPAQTPDERRVLALRHAQLLLRGLAAELERESRSS
jgi:hypothetical protein